MRSAFQNLGKRLASAGPLLLLASIVTLFGGTEWAASGQSPPDTNGVRVLIITGGHDHEAAFYSLFEGYKDIGWPSVSDSKLAFEQDLRAKYDVLVFYNFTRDLDEAARKNLRDFVESKKGIVVLHHGILSFQKWPWWYEEVVGGLYRLEPQGDIPGSTVKFGEQHLITPAKGHPITAHLEPFRITDETYKGLFISPKVTPLLTTDNATSDRVVAWIGPCTTSKVVFIQLGHDHISFSHPSYRALVHNSILWSAGRLK
jgi:type 1 glutamine amidotransferase